MVILCRFAGYFECQLYKDVTLNTHPPTLTPNMFSWFPIFFPLREPVYVPAGAEVEAQMWRCCSPHKVNHKGVLIWQWSQQYRGKRHWQGP